uniref:NADH dehydrogenase subunit 6 n=1 Tax=Gonepteryx amintha TaxID=441324 RepID=UPI002551FBB0|nr:NADH dehydrogenase subunit 6 [Gonepteryx amintha]WGL40172.1 NADH dehydrogenase subunit 6 [Gonepteryx amintha]WHS18938.1 NADH dehydrogenase subunit 6 [Gonepteryx amintha]
MKLFISLLLIFFSLIMFFINHPLAMGLFILLQTMIISLFIGMFLNTYWFSYILFLVFLGGLLVLFIYVSSIASNELMKFSLSMKMSLLLFIFSSMIISYINFKNINLLNLSFNYEMNNINSLFYFFDENKINLSKLYDKQTYFLTMMLIIYLFITLIAVIKITNIFFGPLRSFN